MNTPSQKSFNLIPAFLFLFAFILRFNLISIGPYHIDCLNLAIQAEETFRTHKLHHLFGSGYPLTVLCGALFVAITRAFSINDAIYAVNLMSVFFSSLCVPAMYLVGRQLFNQTIGLLSAILLNVLPVFLGLSIYGTSHTPCLFFLLIGIYFLTRHLKDGKKSNLFIGALAIGLMGACRGQDFVLMLIPLSSLFLARTPNTIRWKYFFAFLGISGATTILFHLPLIIGQHSASYNGQFLDFLRQCTGANFRGFFSPSLLRSLVFLNFNIFPLGILIAAIGLVQIAQKQFRTFLFLLLWVIVPLSFYGNLHSTAPRFLLLSTVPLLLAIGHFFFIFSIPLKNVINKFSIILFFILTFTMLSSIYPVLKLRHQHALLPEFAKWISEKTEDNALIIAGDESFFIQHYTTRKILYRPTNAFAFPKEELSKFKSHLDALLAQKIPVYIDTNGLYSYDADQQFSNLIKNNYTLSLEGKHLIEEWYPGEIFDDVQWMELFKITER